MTKEEAHYLVVAGRAVFWKPGNGVLIQNVIFMEMVKFSFKLIRKGKVSLLYTCSENETPVSKLQL